MAIWGQESRDQTVSARGSDQLALECHAKGSGMYPKENGGTVKISTVLPQGQVCGEEASLYVPKGGKR